MGHLPPPTQTNHGLNETWILSAPPTSAVSATAGRSPALNLRTVLPTLEQTTLLPTGDEAARSYPPGSRQETQISREVPYRRNNYNRATASPVRPNSRARDQRPRRSYHAHPQFEGLWHPQYTSRQPLLTDIAQHRASRHSSENDKGQVPAEQSQLQQRLTVR